MLKKNFFILLVTILILFSPLFSLQNQGAQEAEEEQDTPEEEVQEVIAPEIPEEPPEQEPLQGTIRGRLLDELGTPLAGVKVSCIDQKGNLVSETVTDEDGNYEFPDLETGEYTVTVNYSGISVPLEIQFEEEEQRPLIPTGLKVFEINSDIKGTSFVRAQWDKMQDVLSYKCEIYVDGEKEPIQQYEDVLNNYIEFGNLKENTTYQIRIFSKNDQGFSTSYALGRILTENKLPLPPFGLSAVYAKNNRLDLVWSSIQRLLDVLLPRIDTAGRQVYRHTVCGEEVEGHLRFHANTYAFQQSQSCLMQSRAHRFVHGILLLALSNAAAARTEAHISETRFRPNQSGETGFLDL